MKDLLKIGIVVLLFVLSMYLSHLLISVLSPALIFVSGVLITLFVLRTIFTSRFAIIARHPYFPVGVLLLFLGSLVVSYLIRDFVKVIAWFLLGWYLFRVLLYLVAEDMYKDISEFLDRVGGE